MVNMNRIKRTVALMLITALMAASTGCWDNIEIDQLFIVTAVGLDKSKDNNEDLDISVQIAKTTSGDQGAKASEDGNDSVIILESSAPTVIEGIMNLNRSSSRMLMFQHNQVLVLGKDFAEHGVSEHLDVFIRDQEARLEVVVVVVDGKAEDVLKADFGQEKISGMFVSNVINSLTKVSLYHRTRMIDFVSRLRDGTISPIALLVNIEEKDDKQILSFDGFAVFKDGKMIGQLNEEEMRGYVWSMGKVELGNVVVQCDDGRAALQIISLNTKKEVTVEKSGKAKVAYTVDAILTVGEMRGFNNMTQAELIPRLTEEGQKKIEESISSTFNKAQFMGTDIFGIGMEINRKQPKQWLLIKERWDTLFPQAEVEVTANVKISSTGLITKSLDMEDMENED